MAVDGDESVIAFMTQSYDVGAAAFITSQVIATLRRVRDHVAMTPHRLLQLNAVITAVSAAAMLAARPYLYPLFGLSSPLWLDVATVVFIAYAVALVAATSRSSVPRAALWAFTIGDGMCFALGLLILIAFWSELTPIARMLLAVTTIVVDGFSIAQFRAARLAR